MKLEDTTLKTSVAIKTLEEQLFGIVKDFYTNLDPAHDFSHIFRVIKFCKLLAFHEKADLEVLLAAAYMHDIGRKVERLSSEDKKIRHEEWGADRAKVLLGKYTHFSDQQIEQICTCIREHRGSTDIGCSSLESAILFDADKIDSVGVLAWGRTFSYAGTIMQPFYTDGDINGHDSEDFTYTVFKEYKQKLSKTFDKMKTETGKRIVKNRLKNMELFYNLMIQEIEGNI